MPAPAGTKRVKGVQVSRPFVFGSIARLFSARNPRPAHVDPTHTHNWTIYIRPISADQDLSHWLKKVQFKLHETYSNSTRIVEIAKDGPQRAECTETGWGEFEVQMKLFFVPEANEKAATLWHALKLHPYGTEEMKESQRMRGEVRSECYEEAVFSEPVEQFFDVLTVDQSQEKGAKGGKGLKKREKALLKTTAELPLQETVGNPYCSEREKAEVAKYREARRKVEALLKIEQEKLAEKEREREELGKEE